MFVNLTKGQKSCLRGLSKKLNFPVKALVRRAVDDFLECVNIEYCHDKYKFILNSLYGTTARSRDLNSMYYYDTDSVARGDDDGRK